MKKFAIPFILTIAVTYLSACAPSNGGLTVNETRARPAFKGENGAVYFVIENNTDSPEALIGASTDIASATEVHMSMQNEQGVMTMSMQDSVQILPGEKVTFKPGGLHVMLVDLKQDLKVGDIFTLTLQFEKTSEITVQVEVREQ